ncbi:hypothetical protein KEM52_003836, partial [Ascosphaera acerosa]
MSILPLITFKAGLCDLDTSTTPHKVTAKPDKGYIYLYEEDEIVHFCWRRRSAPVDDPEIDLFMVPGDGSFVPYRPASHGGTKSPTNGRVFALKFSSSSQRYLFYLQSQSQAEDRDPAHWSRRDLRLGEVVHAVLQGDEINLTSELLDLHRSGTGDGHDGGDGGDDDDDETMEDQDGNNGEEHERQPLIRDGEGGSEDAGAGG